MTVKFDSYTGPTLHDGTVPIIPIQRSWFSSGSKLCSRLQISLKLAWAITIHKSQGLTLNKAVIDTGKKEFSAGLTFVACSRVRELDDLLFVPPFSFKRMASLGNSSRLKERLAEDKHLILLSSASFYPKSDPDALGPLFSADQPGESAVACNIAALPYEDGENMQVQEATCRCIAANPTRISDTSFYQTSSVPVALVPLFHMFDQQGESAEACNVAALPEEDGENMEVKEATF